MSVIEREPETDGERWWAEIAEHWKAEAEHQRVISDQLQKRRSELASQLEGAVEALKFYADPKTWDTISPRGTVTTHTLAVQDGGERARHALGGR